MNSFIEKLKNLLIEPEVTEVPAEPKDDKKEFESIVKEIEKPADPITEVKKEEPVKEVKPTEVVKESKPVKEVKVEKEVVTTKVVEEKKSTSPFLNVEDKIEEDRREEVRKQREAYRSGNVISPIFGSKKNDFSLGEPQLEIDNDVVSESIIGTVFSPINGRSTRVKETVKDTVDEKVANMTVSDFIVKDDEPVNGLRHLVAPTLTKAVVTAADKIEEAEKAVDEIDKTEKFENLSLFD